MRKNKIAVLVLRDLILMFDLEYDFILGASEQMKILTGWSFFPGAALS